MTRRILKPKEVRARMRRAATLSRKMDKDAAELAQIYFDLVHYFNNRERGRGMVAKLFDRAETVRLKVRDLQNHRQRCERVVMKAVEQNAGC